MAAKEIVQRWATAVSTHSGNGRRIIFRFADELRPDFDKSSQPHRIILAWRYSSETGQPRSEDHRLMNVMEDLLEGVLDDSNLATLVLVSTGDEMREWTYYARSEAEFMARLNYALTGHEPFPIEVHTAADPTWEMYNVFRDGVKQT